MSKQWCGCHCLGFLTCTQMPMNAIAHWGCANTISESALRVDWAENPSLQRWIKPASVSWLAFWSDAQPAELLCPLIFAFLVFVCLSVDSSGEAETQNPSDVPPNDRTFTVSSGTDERLPAVVPLPTVSNFPLTTLLHLITALYTLYVFLAWCVWFWWNNFRAAGF